VSINDFTFEGTCDEAEEYTGWYGDFDECHRECVECDCIEWARRHELPTEGIEWCHYTEVGNECEDQVECGVSMNY